MLGLYTGARLNELCQLHLSDVKPVDGVLVFDINDRDDHEAHPKRLKNPASERLIPIHSRLIKLGFLDFLNRQKDANNIRVFPELKWNEAEGYGRNVGRWFNEQYLRRVAGIKDKKKSFHSFRHTVANHLKQKGVAESYIGELLGHSPGSITMGRYGKVFQPRVLLDEAIQRLIFFDVPVNKN